MPWTLELSATAVKQLRKLDRPVVERVLDYLQTHIAPLDDPRSVGKALKGSVFGAFWRYRVGDYRIICHIEDSKLCVLVVEVGHRREVYA